MGQFLDILNELRLLSADFQDDEGLTRFFSLLQMFNDGVQIDQEYVE